MWLLGCLSQWITHFVCVWDEDQPLKTMVFLWWNDDTWKSEITVTFLASIFVFGKRVKNSFITFLQPIFPHIAFLSSYFSSKPQTTSIWNRPASASTWISHSLLGYNTVAHNAELWKVSIILINKINNSYLLSHSHTQKNLPGNSSIQWVWKKRKDKAK